MAYEKSIELFLANGTADSLIIAELSNWCLLIGSNFLEFTDFHPDFWYNICKGFDKTRSFSLQLF